jgi:glutamine---fructose-6-phosphate transaminase (isomerizing)
MLADRPGAKLRESILQQREAVKHLLEHGQPARSAADRLAGCSRLFLVGTGTSFHGCLVGQYLFRSIGFDALAVPAFEFSQYPVTLTSTDGLIVLSHRGTKRFSRASLDLMATNSRWVVITGEGSPLEGEGVLRTVPQERSPVHTVSHTAAMVRLVQMALHLGGMQMPWADAVAGLAIAVAGSVALEPWCARAVNRIRGRRLISVVGGGPAWATALEGALKIREAAYVVTCAFDVEAILHGPMASINEEDAVILITEPGPSLKRSLDVTAGLKEIGVPVVAVGSVAGQVPANSQIVTPALPEVLAPLINVVPLQWMAYFLADSLGVDADSFRRGEPRYTAAYERYQL